MNTIIKLFLGMALVALCTAGCNDAHSLSVPVPDSIPIVKQIDTIYDENQCLVHVQQVNAEFADEILRKDLASAFSSFGNPITVRNKPTFKEIDAKNIWYRAPINAIPFDVTGFASRTISNVSSCIYQKIQFAQLFRSTETDNIDAYFTFRNGDKFLYVLLPAQRLLIAARTLEDY